MLYNLRRFSPLLIASLFFAATLGLMAALDPVQAQESENTQENTEDITNLQGSAEIYRLIDRFSQIMSYVRTQYYRDVSDEELIDAAIRGMLERLDPHSSYQGPDDFNRQQIQMRGEFGGLGIEVTSDPASGAVRIVSPIDDTPASRAGLQPNDLIIEIDGELVPQTLDEAVEKMRGPVDTSIVLTIKRGEEIFDVELVRKRIKIRSTYARAEGNVGYIRLAQFNGQAAPGIKSAIEELKDEIGEDEIAGYILDLRSNPGGLLDQAIEIVDIFLEAGEIVSVRGRDVSTIARSQATKGDLADGKPLVILINGGSASASEVVAGAIQDHRRGVIMGETSFGKGSVQTLFYFGDSADPMRREALKLTTQLYYTPSGESIQGRGIVPDIFVPRAEVNILSQNRIHSSRNPNAIENPQGEEDESAQEADDRPANERPIEDYQLQRAIDAIRAADLLIQGHRSESAQDQDKNGTAK